MTLKNRGNRILYERDFFESLVTFCTFHKWKNIVQEGVVILLVSYFIGNECLITSTGEGDYNTQQLFGALFRDFSNDGCYSGSLARPNF